MFSALSQGSLIHILDKTDGLKYKVGEVIGVTQPNQFGGAFGAHSFNNPNSSITIKVNVNGTVQEYPEVPPAQNVMSYNNGKVFISETLQGIQTEVENIHKRSKQILDNRDYYEKEVADCESIMKEINPGFAKDKERDSRIDALDTKVTSMGGKLDEILNMLAGKNSSTLKN